MSTDQQQEELDPEVLAAGGRKGPDGRAATIAPASAVNSRIGSRSNSRAGSRIGSRVDERLADMANNETNVFYAQGAKNGGKAGHSHSGSVENDGSWFAASRRVHDAEEDEAEKRLSSANISKLLGKLRTRPSCCLFSRACVGTLVDEETV